MINKDCCFVGTYEHSVKITDNIFCDKCLVKEIKSLNEIGVKTVASCCGHGLILPTILVDQNDIFSIEYMEKNYLEIYNKCCPNARMFLAKSKTKSIEIVNKK